MGGGDIESTRASEPAGDGFGRALGAAAQAELARAARQLRREPSRLHRGVHQARKSLRRVRAMLALADVGAGGERVDRKLRRLLRGLSSLRDAHIVLETLDRLAGDGDLPLRQAALRALRGALRHRRDARLRLALLEDSSFAATIARIERVGAIVAALPWPQATRADADAALERARERAHRAGDRARAKPDAERLHRWRRRLRRVRQQTTVLMRLTGDAGDVAFVDTALLDALGRRQDLSVLRSVLAELGSLDPGTRATVSAAIERALAAIDAGLADRHVKVA